MFKKNKQNLSLIFKEDILAMKSIYILNIMSILEALFIFLINKQTFASQTKIGK